MTHPRMAQDSNPLLFVTTNNEARKILLCRTLERIWEKPVFLIRSTIRETLSHAVDQSLLGKSLIPDLILIDLASGGMNSAAIFDTIRSISGLRRAPMIALLDGENNELMYQTYDAGANLVVFWDRLESRTGDIAALAIDNWLNTEDEPQSEEHTRSG